MTLQNVMLSTSFNTQEDNKYSYVDSCSLSYFTGSFEISRKLRKQKLVQATFTFLTDAGEEVYSPAHE